MYPDSLKSNLFVIKIFIKHFNSDFSYKVLETLSMLNSLDMIDRFQFHRQAVLCIEINFFYFLPSFGNLLRWNNDFDVLANNLSEILGIYSSDRTLGLSLYSSFVNESVFWNLFDKFQTVEDTWNKIWTHVEWL